LERDEGEYFYSAGILKDGIPPYTNSFLVKPPMIIYTYYLALLINPEAVWPPRVIAFIFTLLTAFLIGLIVKKEYGKAEGIFAMFIFIVMNSFPYLAPFAANTERFMQLPLVAVLAIYVYHKNNPNYWPYFWSGLLASIAISYKQFCLLPLIVIFAFWLINKTGNYSLIKDKFIVFFKKFHRFPCEEKSAVGQCAHSEYLKYIAAIFLGGFLGIIIIYAYLFIANSFSDFWKINYDFCKYYASQYDPENFIHFFNIFWSNWPIFCLLIPWFILRRKNQTIFYLSLFFVSLFSIFMSSLGHYYLLLIPFWAIICAASLGDISTLISRKTTLLKNKVGENIFKICFFSFFLLIIIFPVKDQFSKSPDAINLWVYGVGNPFDEARILGAKLKEITAPKDKVFIAGSEAEILFYAKRESSSEFVITYPFTIETPFQEGYQRKAVAELQNNLPKAIVYSNQEESGLYKKGEPTIFKDYLDKIIAGKYQLVGGFVRNPDLSGQWKEPISEEEKKLCTLLLYKIK
jgi:hypothetical protein